MLPGRPAPSRGATAPAGTPFARLDDLVTGRALAFPTPRPDGGPVTLSAQHPEDVLVVLDAVEAAAAAGWWAVGFVSYEAAAGLPSHLPVSHGAPQRAGRARSPGDHLPLVWFGLFAPPVEVPTVQAVPADHWPFRCTAWQLGWDQEDYRRQVQVVRGRIAAGDTYQCNLTVRLHAHAGGELLGLYRALALAQGGAHNAYVDTGHHVVASASPELFFHWEGDHLTTRPMKGTAPRGRWPEEDARQAQALRCSPKDRAENVMIVDLLRNDVGTIAAWGSVGVPVLCELERFGTVWQLTSTVTGRTRAGTTLADVFGALFPCGSVTGAPKHATMGLIAELETEPRGVYCGAVGVVAPPGSGFRARFNVAIRTAVVDRCRGTAVYGTGGGITWGSTPAGEHAELLVKAALLHAPVDQPQLIETMAYRPATGVRNLERHLARLGASAWHLGFAFNAGRVRAALEEALEDVRDQSPGASARVRVALARHGEVEVATAPLPRPDAGPVVLEVDPEPVDTSGPWAFHKTTWRERYEAAAARHPGAGDVVLVNERGQVTETTIANLAVQLHGWWWTPPVVCGCLPGVERGRLVELGTLRERVLSVEDLAAADQVALVSSLRGWRPAVLSEI